MERNYEEEAAEQGWNPDYDGPNKTDAKTFVEKGEKIAGIANARNKNLEARLHNLEDANRKFGEYHKLTLEREQRKGAKQIAELQNELAQAITDGDGQKYQLLDREIDDLKASQNLVSSGSMDEQAWGQLSQRWMVDNPWYNQNTKLQIYADGLAEKVQAQGFSGAAYFSELSRQVKEAFPEEFKNPAKSNANAVEDGGQKASSNSKEHTYANLPADAKAAFKDFNRDFGLSKEDYLANYEWDE